jgi:hypothetical protein
MKLSRREWLRTAGMAVAAVGIDPELLIWQPRQSVIVPGFTGGTPVYHWSGPIVVQDWRYLVRIASIDESVFEKGEERWLKRERRRQLKARKSRV